MILGLVRDNDQIFNDQINIYKDGMPGWYAAGQKQYNYCYYHEGFIDYNRTDVGNHYQDRVYNILSIACVLMVMG